MGTINHNAIIATTYDQELADDFQEWLDRQQFAAGLVLISQSQINNYKTFVFVPDGSKEGWLESETADALRELFLKQLTTDDYEDGSSPWDWVEVGFGEYGQKVLRGNCKNCFNDKEYAGVVYEAEQPPEE